MAPQMISSSSSNQYHDDDDESFYVNVSAATTTTTSSLSFYSAPTSPRRSKFDHQLPPKSFTSEHHHFHHEDDDDDGPNIGNFIEFEFETSRRFPAHYDSKEGHHRGRVHRESLPAMAFADELFCDGKVVPLKPPPRLRNVNCIDNSLSSPRSPSTSRRFTFSRRILWNDDFDPFMVALENVKDDDIPSIDKPRKKDHRRTRSMSPLRALGPMRSVKCISFRHLSGPNEEKKSPIGLAEPTKGVVFARHSRMVRMGHTESEEFCRRETKRHKIKKFLVKSASMGRLSNHEEKQKEEALLPERSFTRKFSFMSTPVKRVPQVTKVTIMQYRPRLFVCLGYGEKYHK